ncbi:MAG: hypothetical protein M3348_01845 [Acidobacteriota bacterium]|nr:hypothetical protein [Acidobacteriota bacterium]
MTLPNTPGRHDNLAARALPALLLFASLLPSAAAARAQNYSLTVEKPMRTIPVADLNADKKPLRPGEAQSAVIPPGANQQCPAGRFVATNDSAVGRDDGKVLGPMNPGVVKLSDLDGANVHDAKIVTDDDTVKKLSPYKFLTKDHDIVAMPNGHLVLVWSMHFATPFAPPATKPGWFDITYHGPGKSDQFGPGTRRGVMTWVSDDCGEHFNYVGMFDPANYDDNRCAFPQYADTGAKPPYKNGGPDGQLVTRDAADPRRLYMMFPCMGQKAKDDGKTDPFTLIDDPLSMTLVLRSGDEGKSWEKLGVLNVSGWRYGVVPLSHEELAFATLNVIARRKQFPGGKYYIDPKVTPLPVEWGWPALDKKGMESFVGFNVPGNTIITRVPGDNNSVLLVIPAVVRKGDGKGYNGYRVLFYDFSKNEYTEAPSVFPATSDSQSFAMHLTAVDLGEGPVLLYWYDMDVAAKKGTIKGRLITGRGLSSGDFYVFTGKPSVKIGVAGPVYKPAGPTYEPLNFDLIENKYWYGDYNTAGGYVYTPPPFYKQGTPKPLSVAQGKQYHFFPMWVGPDSAIQFAQVTVVEQPSQVFSPATLKVTQMLAWRPAPPPVDPSKRKPSPAEVRDLLGYEKQSEEQDER